MADVIFQGGMKALVDGDLASAPDIRGKLVMGDFTGAAEEDAINLDDITTIDEFDGVGYVELDCANVAMAYDATDDEYQLTFDAGYFNADDDEGTVDAGSDDWIGILWYLYVDGTDANDVAVAFEDTGAGNGVGTAVLYTPHADGAIYLGAAA